MKNIDLTIFGLNETEAAIYATSLRVGPSAVQNLAREAGVKRSTSYFAIDNLIEKGFLHQKIAGKKKIVAAIGPEYLRNICKKELNLIEEKRSAVEEIVPQLKAMMHDSPSQSKVSYFEGTDNLWHIFEDILKEKADVYWLGDFSVALKHLDFQELLDRFSKKRRQISRTKSFVISDSHQLAQKLWRLEDTDFRELRFLPKDIELESALIIYGNKVALISFENLLSATLLENRSIATMMKAMFKIIWSSAAKEPI